jgi:hypothetical protein
MGEMDRFESADEAAVHCASTILATVVPLTGAPIATRKPLLRCVLALQTFS